MRSGEQPPCHVTDGGWPGDAGPGDAALGTATRDRQILVAGAGPGGLALTALLDRAGYDPVVVGPGTTATSRTAVLPPVARDVLERAGVALGDPDSGPRVETVVSHRELAGGTTTRDHLEPAPAVLSPERLCDRLRESVAENVVGRCVTAVDDDGDALEVTFDHGVREWFDLVVVTGRTEAWDDPPVGLTDPAELDQFEAVVDADPGTNRVVERLTDRSLEQLRPLPDGSGSLLRLTTAAGEPEADTDADADLNPTEAVARAVAGVEDGPLGAVSPDEVGAASRATVRQVVGPSGDWGGDRGGGRVAACGASALPVAPATGFRATVALEDAWTLTDELVRGSGSVPVAVGTYARRRRRRVERLPGGSATTVDGRRGDDGVSVADADASPLAALARYRAAALARFRDPDPTALGPGDDRA